MSKLYFSSSDSLFKILEKIKVSPETSLNLEIPPDNIFWQSQINKELLEKIAQKQGKSLIWEKEEKEDVNVTSVPIPPGTSAVPPLKKSKRKWFKVSLIVFLVFTLFIVGGVAFVYYYLPKATIFLEVEEKTLERTEEVFLIPDLTKLDLVQAKLPGKKLSVTETEEESFAATGQETVGEKATGIVSLQNWTDSSIIFMVSTKLTVSSNQTGSGLGFVTTQEVSVPAQILSTPEPGKKLYEAGVANVKIEAEKFGEEYNLLADTQFSVNGKDPTSVVASNTQALTGGTTRQITVVSPDDLARSKKQLSGKLFAQGKIDLESKLLGDQKLVLELLENQIIEEVASAVLGEQVDKFSLKTTTQSLGLTYSESELREIILSKLKDLIPEGYRISGEEKAILIQNAQKENEGAKLMVKIKTLVIPDLNLDELKTKLLGKAPSAAIEILSQEKQILSFQIQTWPLLPKFMQILPHQVERLTIQIEAQ